MGFVCVMGLILLMLSGEAYSAEQGGKEFDLDIPRSNAAEAINRLAEQTGAVLLFPYELAASRQSRPLKGRYGVGEALAIMLADSGLKASLSRTGIIRISLAKDDNKNRENEMITNQNKPRKSFLAAMIASFFGGNMLVGDVGAQEVKLEEIIVTAQKREQSSNEVPMSISNLSGEAMELKGIDSVADLQKVITGFRYSASNQGTPIYYIRGVGFNESSLGARSNVAVYVDEVAMPFPIMTGGVGLDLERVEVLKGPQGTLFGQSTTSGAINYIAGKPTDEFEASVTAGIGRYDSKLVRGFVSGPLTETLAARAAIKWEDSGPWQQSSTSDREIGDKDKISGRVSFVWKPVDSLDIGLTYFKHRDKSDLQANQFQSLKFQQDTLARTYIPAETVAILDNYQPADKDNRSADWGPLVPKQDSDMDQISLRADWDVSEQATLTYIYANSEFDMDRLSDTDGVYLNNFNVQTFGDISSDSHELRLAGSTDQSGINWMVGVNYEDSEVDHLERLFLDDTGNGYALVGLSGGNLDAYFNTTDNSSYQEFTSKAVFGSLDFGLTETVSGHVSARYTDSEVDFTGCTKDIGDNVLANAFNVGLFGGAPVIPRGGCITLDIATFSPVLVEDTLKEDNTSWRAGLDWKPTEDSMYYANISQGYKDGSFPTLSASEATQYTPVTAESLLAYEVGFKLSLADQTMQLNGALFYYDYEDKQIRGRVTVPVFGPLEALVNVPDSEVLGGELQWQWKPTAAWTLGLNTTYLDTQINNYQGYDGLGVIGDFDGESFPNTPDLMVGADAQYDWYLDNGMNLFIGGNLAYQGDTNSNFGEIEQFDVDSYTVLDLRAGVISSDGRWRVLIWGENVTDEYYWVAANRSVDTTIRIAGAPPAYGVEFTYNFY